MLRMLAILFGVAFIVMGVAGGGMMPQWIENKLLFGHFSIDLLHNLVYLVTGVIALITAITPGFSKLFFIVFGLMYALMAGIGIGRAGDIYVMHNNMSDNYLFIAIAFVLLVIGLTAKHR